MKQILLIFALFCASYMTVNAQTNTWTGNADINWSNTGNWSLSAVPTASHDVVIPTGKTVNLNVAGTTKSIVVQGNSTLNMPNNLSILNASSFAANVTVNWTSASLIGGGTMTNNGTINLNTAGNRYISGATTLNNNGMVTMPIGGTFNLFDTSIFNNTANGVFDIQEDCTISYSGTAHNFINAGLLKKTGGANTAFFDAIITNTGTISVESGILAMNSLAKTFNGGIYNVTTGSQLGWGTQINVSGTLTGLLDGAITWVNNVSVATTATFNFTGDTRVNWNSGSLIGGGTLNNASTIDLTTNGNRYISGDTTLNNTGLVTIPDGGTFNLFDASIFNNTAGGVFDIQEDCTISYSGSTHNFINAGLLKKTGGANAAFFDAIITNTGTIRVESGSLAMNSLAKNLNGGIYNVNTGSQLSWGTQINVFGTLTGLLDGAITWVNNVSVATTATFNFTGDTGVNWNSGSLIGGGTLNNASTIDLTTNGNRYISGGTTLNNTGLVTIPDGGTFNLFDTSIFNNTASGVFDIQEDCTISYSGTAHNFINTGLLKKTSGANAAFFDAILTNTGTIRVESGSLAMNSLAKNFNGGVYNVSPDDQLVFGTQINVTGTLTGLLDGAITWVNNVSVATTATFNFTGDTGVNWNTGSLIGGGTLTNASTIDLTTNGNRYISGGTTLNNTGLVTIPDGGTFNLFDTSIFNNTASGVFDIQEDCTISYSGTAHNFINTGLLKKSGGINTAFVDCILNNSGTISADSGVLNLSALSKTNTIDGIIKGTATIGLPAPANFTNNGTFAPGGSPGTLTVLGTYKSSPTSVLDVELYGLVPNTGYDVLAITGNANFDGNVNVTMNFAASINDEFIVATTTGTISQCNLAASTSADFGGMTYTFDVFCRTNNQVVLKLVNITLGLDEFQLSESSIQLYPNPVRNMLTIKNVNNLELINGQITDITGKVITTFNLKDMESSKEISLENLSNGMYFVKINGLNSSITKRVIKR